MLEITFELKNSKITITIILVQSRSRTHYYKTPLIASENRSLYIGNHENYTTSISRNSWTFSPNHDRTLIESVSSLCWYQGPRISNGVLEIGGTRSSIVFSGDFCSRIGMEIKVQLFDSANLTAAFFAKIALH